ncbi:MAG: MDR family MFS transporter, partial [Candidatus Limnocylindrales bacterium]
LETGQMTTADHARPPLARRSLLWLMVGLMVAMLLAALDQTIVGTALPKIFTDLGGNEYYTWVVTIYLLTSTITVPFYGKLSDIYGRKPMLIFGVTVFLIGSALSGLSQNMAMLIAFRGIQGIGAGALFPIALAVIGDLFTPAERGRYQGLFGAVFGISFIIGPALGGLLTDNISWHWIFYVNIPVGILSLVVIARLLPTIKSQGASRDFDFLGAFVFTIAISLLLVGLTNKQTGDWTEPAVGGLLLASAVLTVLFLWIEARAKEPIIPLGMFRNRTYSASLLSTFLVSFGFFGAIIFLPRWFQFVNGSSATESGYQIFPLLIGLIGSSIVSGILVSRTGKYKAIILVGLGVMGVGLALMTQLHADTPITTLWAWMFITGVGIGPTLSVFTIVVQNAVPFRQLGVATSNLTFFRQIGGSIGLAVTGTVFGTRLVEEFPRQLAAAGLPPQAVQQFGSAGFGAVNDLVGVGGDLGAQILALVPAAFREAVEPLVPAIVAGIHEAFSLANSAAFQIGLVTTIGAFVAALAVREIPLRTETGEGRAVAPEASHQPVGGRLTGAGATD